MGFDEPRSLKEYAATTALPMWIYFMGEALKGKPEHSPPQPPDIITARIDPDTGLLAKSGQTNAIYEIFTKDTVPTQNAPDPDEESSSSNVESLF
jgi:penicillin-binding protein 1A